MASLQDRYAHSELWGRGAEQTEQKQPNPKRKPRSSGENYLFYSCLCVWVWLFSLQPICLSWWPLFRDAVFYILSILVLILVRPAPIKTEGMTMSNTHPERAIKAYVVVPPPRWSMTRKSCGELLIMPLGAFVSVTGDINRVCFRWETIILISMYGIYIIIMKWGAHLSHTRSFFCIGRYTQTGSVLLCDKVQQISLHAGGEPVQQGGAAVPERPATLHRCGQRRRGRQRHGAPQTR